MNQSILEDVIVDLLVDDVMSDDPILEFNPSRDAAGKFTAKGAGEAYAHGVMAAGRVAGMQAKRKGADREGIRTAIKAGMEKHVQTVQHAKSFLNNVYGQGAGDDVRNVLDVMSPKFQLKNQHITQRIAAANQKLKAAKNGNGNVGSDTKVKLDAKRQSQHMRQSMKDTITR